MKESEFQFHNYRVSKFSFEVQDEFGKEQENFEQHIQITSNFFDQDPNLVEVFLGISISTQTKTLNLLLEIKGLFSRNPSMPDDLFRKIAKQNAPAILYPFARGILANFTALSNIPILILPLMNFTEQSQVSEEK